MYIDIFFARLIGARVDEARAAHEKQSFPHGRAFVERRLAHGTIDAKVARSHLKYKIKYQHACLIAI
jgi:hypothetical protein